MSRTIRTIFLLLAFLAAGISRAAGEDSVRAYPDSCIASNLDAYITQVINRWNIPGMGVAVMRHDSLILCKGYGVKEIGKPDPVDGNTVFHIGSVSKSFTAAVIASLVDEGLVAWDDTVKNILPDLELCDKWVEEHLQVKDIMTHHTGLAGQDGTYFPNLGYDRDEIYHMLRFLKPVYVYRGEFQYNNLTFLIAARIIEKLTGKTWDENVRERILEPLSMTSTGTSAEFYTSAENAATQHSSLWRDGSFHNEALRGEDRALWWLDAVGPAGSVVSTPADLVKWVQFHKNGGVSASGRVISEKQMDYLHQGRTIVRQDPDAIRLYAHCWYVDQDRHGRLYYHTGTTWGMTALCAWHPQLDFSIVILVNNEITDAPRWAVLKRLRDLCEGAPDTDYSAISFESRLAERASSGEAVNNAAAEPAPTAEMHRAKFYVGRYENEWPLGEAVVTETDGKLLLQAGGRGWVHELEHIDGDRFEMTSQGHTFPVEFTPSPDGRKAASLRIDFDNRSDCIGPWTRVGR